MKKNKKLMAMGLVMALSTAMSLTSFAATQAELEGISLVNSTTSDGTYSVGDVLTVKGVDYEDGMYWERNIETSEGFFHSEIIEGATGLSYTIQEEDSGARVGLFVPVDDVDWMSGKSFVTDAPVEGEPYKFLASIATDYMYVPGATLSAITSKSSGAMTYEWYRGSEEIAGETGATYTLTDEDINNTIKVVVTDSSYGTAEATSSSIMDGSGMGMDVVMSPKNMWGVGDTISVKTFNATSITSYQWYYGDMLQGYTAIEGETGSTYTVKASDIDKMISVEVTGIDATTGSPNTVRSAVGCPSKETASTSSVANPLNSLQSATTSTFDDVALASAYTAPVQEQVEVTVSQSAQFTVNIPKKVVLNGSTGSGNYAVKVAADIPGNHQINVVPAVNTLALSSAGKDDIEATITQAKTAFNVATDTQAGLLAGVEADGNISTDDLSAGRWTGNFDFNIEVTAAA